MADMYAAVRSGGLKLKGEKKMKKKKRSREEKVVEEEVEIRHGRFIPEEGVGIRGPVSHAPDMPPFPSSKPGLFWLVSSASALTGSVLVETQSGGYLEAVDDGTLTVGLPKVSFVQSPQSMAQGQVFPSGRRPSTE